jgi:hypothetical protein
VFYFVLLLRWCECSCDVHVCSILCCSLGGASALLTLICVLCTLRLRISRSICNVTHYRRLDTLRRWWHLWSRMQTRTATAALLVCRANFSFYSFFFVVCFLFICIYATGGGPGRRQGRRRSHYSYCSYVERAFFFARFCSLFDAATSVFNIGLTNNAFN